MKKQIYKLGLGVVMLFAFAATSFAQGTWVGGEGFTTIYSDAQAGDHFFIAGSEFDDTVGHQITKVKFYHYLGTVNGVTYTNTTYTVKIYENPTLGGSYASMGIYETSIGTPVYTQTVTLTSLESGNYYELALDVPYTINTNNYWVGISFDNGKGAMTRGTTAGSTSEYYMYFHADYFGTVITSTELALDPAYPLGISLCINDGTSQVENVDLLTYFIDEISLGNKIDSITITDSQSLILIPVIQNGGPDTTSQSTTLTATANNGETLILLPVLQSSMKADSSLYYIDPLTSSPYTFSVEELNTLGLTGTFQIILSAPYPNDADTLNNFDTLTVTIVPSVSDLYAQFVDNSNDKNPTSTVSIKEEESLVLYPLLGNNGPDSANKVVSVSITSGSQILYSEDIDLSGVNSLQANSTIILEDEGEYFTYTASDLENLGLTGTFDITYIVTYTGNDNIATNDTATLTVTRTTVGIVEQEQNIAVSLYPNPATDILYVESSSTIGSLTICDISGRMIKQWNNVENSVEINDLASGIYLVKIQTPQGSTTQKIVKQ